MHYDYLVYGYMIFGDFDPCICKCMHNYENENYFDKLACSHTFSPLIVLAFNVDVCGQQTYICCAASLFHVAYVAVL